MYPGFGDHPFEEYPATPDTPSVPRIWKTRQGQFQVHGFTGRRRQVQGVTYDHFQLPDGEQVPCSNHGKYGCEHWVSEGWMNAPTLLCGACADARDKETLQCGC